MERTDLTDKEVRDIQSEFTGIETSFSDSNIYYSIFGSRGEYIESVYIFGKNGLNLVSNLNISLMSRFYTDIKKMEVIKQAEKASGRMLWLYSNEDRFLDSEFRFKKYITGIRKLKVYNSIYSGRDVVWGYLVININERYIAEVYQDMIKDNNEDIFVVDVDGRIVSHTDKNRLSNQVSPRIRQALLEQQSGNIDIDIDGQLYTLFYYTSRYNDWKIINLLPKKLLTASVTPIRNSIILISVMIISIAIGLALIITDGISSPIDNLLKKMNLVREGNLDVRVNVNSNDEIGRLSNNFNYMIKDIKKLMETIKEEEKQLRKLELKALQAQINPHFLYNTLDSIYCHTITKDYQEIGDITVALSQLFRLSLNKGKEKTTIGKEIEHVKNYLIIQKIRYRRKFNYKINVSPEIEHCECINLIIQPLVENSLVHGFEQIESGGFIIIKGFKRDNSIILQVIDNGCGIDEEQINDSLREKDYQKGYGLSNIDERIKLYYGKQYGLYFSPSSDNSGTIAEIKLPFIKVGG